MTETFLRKSLSRETHSLALIFDDKFFYFALTNWQERKGFLDVYSWGLYLLDYEMKDAEQEYIWDIIAADTLELFEQNNYFEIRVGNSQDKEDGTEAFAAFCEGVKEEMERRKVDFKSDGSLWCLSRPYTSRNIRMRFEGNFSYIYLEKK